MPTTKFDAGDIVAVDFPFANLQNWKRRPGLVLAFDGLDYLLARITSHPPRDAWDMALSEWRVVGLPLGSTVRLSKLATVEERLIHHRVGRLTMADRKTVLEVWRKFAVHIGERLSGRS